MTDEPARQTESARETFDHIRAAAEKARGGGDSFSCRCPAHEDREPSLHVTLEPGRVLLNCFAGCEADAVVRAFGLTLADLFDRDPSYHGAGEHSSPRLRTEAVNIAEDAAADDAHRPPIPCSDLAAALDMLKHDGRRGIAQLRAVAAGDDWGRLETVDRAVLTTWADGRAGRQTWAPAIAATLGTVDRGGRYRPAPAPEQPAAPRPDTLADMPPVEQAAVVAHDVFNAGRLGLIHGPTGGGKTHAMAIAAAKVTQRGMLFAGKATMTGDVLICTEDPETWRDVVAASGGDLSRVKVRAPAELHAAIREIRPVAVAVDTMAYLAHASGSGELDSAAEVDRILRPLAALTRETGAAISVADHEPWKDKRAGGAGLTEERPRHSGAKVATCDFIMRCNAEKDVLGERIETITIGPSKVKGARRGIQVSKVTINLDGELCEPGGDGGDGDRYAKYRHREDDVREYLMANPTAAKRAVRVALGIRGNYTLIGEFVEACRASQAGVPRSAPNPPERRNAAAFRGVPTNGNAGVPAFRAYKGTPVPGTGSGGTDLGFTKGGGVDPEGGATMLVAEQEHATEQATTEQEPTTAEQPIEAAAAVEAAANLAPSDTLTNDAGGDAGGDAGAVDAGAVDAGAVDAGADDPGVVDGGGLRRIVHVGIGVDRRTLACRVFEQTRPVVSAADIDDILDGVWFRQRPGPAGNLGRPHSYPWGVVYERTLTADERASERAVMMAQTWPDVLGTAPPAEQHDTLESERT